MTEGVLLRQAVSDRTLSQYDVIVLDEVHERHVSTDLLLVRIKKSHTVPTFDGSAFDGCTLAARIFAGVAQRPGTARCAKPSRGAHVCDGQCESLR